MPHALILPLVLATALLPALPAFAQDEAFPRPAGTVRVELDLSDGQTRELVFEEFNDAPWMVDTENPTLICNPPFTRQIQGFSRSGPAVIVELGLEFNDYELNRPTLNLLGNTNTSLVGVDLRSNSKPEEIAKWKPAVMPRRDGNYWIIDTEWDFDPAALTFDLQDPNKAPEYVSPSWIDPDSGAATAKTITRVRVIADLRLRATYEEEGKPERQPCP